MTQDEPSVDFVRDFVADKICKCDPWDLPGVREAVAEFYKDAIKRAWDELQKPYKLYPVMELSRDMLAEHFGCDKLLELTDEQMIRITDKVWNECIGDAFWESVESTLEYLEIEHGDEVVGNGL